jgi:polar amino acid transport system substrate-binding protein
MRAYLVRITTIASVLLTAAAATAVAGCSPQGDAGPATTTSAGALTCAKTDLKTLAAGKLTIGTDDPVYPPWFVDNKPDNSQGFEGAVAYAVASKLGYDKANVVWTRVTFNNAIAPGPKTYDFDVNEFSITDERKKAVDFSAPYYDVTQAVIALKTSKIAGVKTIAALKDAKLGAQVGTTSYKAITDVIKPNAQPAVYNNNDDAKKKLEDGSIDGLVLDLPTAFYVTSAEIANSVIVGQLPQPAGQPEQFGLVLDKGSTLTRCVSGAVEALRKDGALASLETEWLAKVAGAAKLT